MNTFMKYQAAIGKDVYDWREVERTLKADENEVPMFFIPQVEEMEADYRSKVERMPAVKALANELTAILPTEYEFTPDWRGGKNVTVMRNRFCRLTTGVGYKPGEIYAMIEVNQKDSLPEGSFEYDYSTFPNRKEGESDQDYDVRYNQWHKDNWTSPKGKDYKRRLGDLNLARFDQTVAAVFHHFKSTCGAEMKFDRKIQASEMRAKAEVEYLGLKACIDVYTYGDNHGCKLIEETVLEEVGDDIKFVNGKWVRERKKFTVDCENEA